MLKPYDFSDDDSADDVKESSDSIVEELTVSFAGSKMLPGQCFGDITSEGNYISVTANGKKIKDFTVKSGNENYLSVKKLNDGRIQLKTLKSYKGNNYPFIITYKNVDYTFYTNDNTWIP